MRQWCDTLSALGGSVVSCSAGFIDHGQLTIDHLSYKIRANDS